MKDWCRDGREVRTDIVSHQHYDPPLGARIQYGVDGNEKACELARKGASTHLVGLSVALEILSSRRRSKDVLQPEERACEGRHKDKGRRRNNWDAGRSGLA